MLLTLIKHIDMMIYLSIRMIKLCSKSVVKPLLCLSFSRTALILVHFQISAWKRSNIVPVHKKGDEQIVDNYRPVSILPIFGKILEKLWRNFGETQLTYDYSCADWGGLRGHLRDEFCEWVQVGIVSLIVSIRLSLTHPHGFQQLVLLPQFIEIIFSFVPTELIF